MQFNVPSSSSCPCCSVRIPFRAFAAGLLFRSKVSRAILVVSLLYTERTVGVCPHLHFLSSILVASKYVEDTCPGLSYWSKWSGIDVKQIAKMEIYLLKSLDYRVSFSKTEFEKWAAHIFGTAESQRTEAASLGCFLSAVRDVMRVECVNEHGVSQRVNSVQTQACVPVATLSSLPSSLSCSRCPSPATHSVVQIVDTASLPTPPKELKDHNQQVHFELRMFDMNGPIRPRARNGFKNARIVPYPTPRPDHQVHLITCGGLPPFSPSKTTQCS